MRKHVKIFSDGAARGNPDGPGGYGAILQYTDSAGVLHEKELSEGFEKTTKTIFINGYRYGGVFAEMATLEDLLPDNLKYVKIDGVYVDPSLSEDDIYIKSQNHKIISAAKNLLRKLVQIKQLLGH